MRRGLEGLILLLLLASSPVVLAGQQIGENSAYAREMGFETRLFYVVAGSDGENQIEYICQAFPGTNGNDDLSSSVWKVQRFYYNSSDQLTRISFAGDDDAYTQVCTDRTSLNYD